MLEIISGTFENGCGVIIKDTKTNKYYHSLVYKDSIIIEGNTYYKEDLIQKEKQRQGCNFLLHML